MKRALILWEERHTFVLAGLGVGPRLSASKAPVLPLDDPAMSLYLALFLSRFQVLCADIHHRHFQGEMWDGGVGHGCVRVEEDF